MLSALVPFLSSLALACTTKSDSTAIAVETVTGGDTVVAKILAANDLPEIVDTIGTLQPIWTPSSLTRIRRVVTLGGQWLATDGRELISYHPATGTERMVGAPGEGPGEYRRIGALHPLPGVGGGLMIADPVLERITRFDATGTLRDVMTIPTAAHGELQELILLDDEATPRMAAAYHRGVVVADGTTEDSVIVASVSGDDVADTLFAVAEGPWVKLGGLLAKRDAYGHRAVVAVGSGGVAIGNGVNYTITWWQPGREPSVVRIERSWQRVSSSIDREPTAAQLEGLGEQRKALQEIVAGQRVGAFKNSVDRIVLAGPDLLLVKPVTDAARYHPYYLGRLPELAPSHWLWEVFRDDGRLVAQLYLPADFVPQGVDGCLLYGVQPDADGLERVVQGGRVILLPWMLLIGAPTGAGARVCGRCMVTGPGCRSYCSGAFTG